MAARIHLNPSRCADIGFAAWQSAWDSAGSPVIRRREAILGPAGPFVAEAAGCGRIGHEAQRFSDRGAQPGRAWMREVVWILENSIKGAQDTKKRHRREGAGGVSEDRATEGSTSG
jgi:hypothetical protein